MAARLLQDLGDVKVHFKIQCTFKKIKIVVDEATTLCFEEVIFRNQWLFILVIAITSPQILVNNNTFNQLEFSIDNFQQNGFNWILQCIMCDE